MELQQIRYFLSVHKYGSFSRAAAEGDVTQPALTAAVKKLESEVGGALFHREGKRLVLSPLGRLVYPALEQAVVGAQSARSIAENFKLLRQAPLRIGMQRSIGPVRMADFLRGFHQRHPGVELALQDGSQEELLARLESGELDLALLSGARPLPDPFRHERLYVEPYVVLLPAGHALASHAGLTLQDLDGVPYVDRLACEMREAVLAVSAARGVHLYATLRSEREDWVEAMVVAGLGFAFMPAYSVVRSAQLQVLPLLDPVVQRDVLAVEVRGRMRSPPAKLFLDEILRHDWEPATGAAPAVRPPLQTAGAR